MNAGHIYVLAFGDGIVKVGRTQHPRRRMSAFRWIARKFGTVIADSWISPLHAESDLNEDTLKALAVKHGGMPISPEYFAGADYDAIVRAALGLPFTPPSAGITEGPGCLRHRGTALACGIRRAAIDAMVRETADSAQKEWWETFKAVGTCRRCEATA